MATTHLVEKPLPDSLFQTASSSKAPANMQDTMVIGISSASTGDVVFLSFSFDVESKTATQKVREYSNEYVELLDKASWTKEFFQTASELNDVASLLPFYKEINLLLARKDFVLCDSFLRQQRTEDLSDTLLVGLLRLTSSWKSQLPSWEALLDRANDELVKRGYDNQALLNGLS